MTKKTFFGLISSAMAFSFFSLVAHAAGVELPTTAQTGLSNKPLADVIANITNWILGIFGFLAIISFIISGIMYILSAGDDAQQERAKKQMTWSIMGVIVGLAGLVVVYAVDAMLNGTSGF